MLDDRKNSFYSIQENDLPLKAPKVRKTDTHFLKAIASNILSFVEMRKGRGVTPGLFSVKVPDLLN